MHIEIVDHCDETRVPEIQLDERFVQIVHYLDYSMIPKVSYPVIRSPRFNYDERFVQMVHYLDYTMIPKFSYPVIRPGWVSGKVLI